jgi:hypothetical protein
MWMPRDVSTLILRGLLVMSLMLRTPRSARMLRTEVYSRQSSGRPSARLASTVSNPLSCRAGWHVVRGVSDGGVEAARGCCNESDDVYGAGGGNSVLVVASGRCTAYSVRAGACALWPSMHCIRYHNHHWMPRDAAGGIQLLPLACNA